MFTPNLLKRADLSDQWAKSIKWVSLNVKRRLNNTLKFILLKQHKKYQKNIVLLLENNHATAFYLSKSSLNHS